MVSIASVSPTYGVLTNDVTLEIVGTGFITDTIARLILPTSPPVTYSLANNTFINNTKIRATVTGSSVPLGIYDVQVDNGGGVTATLSQTYRSDVALQDPFGDQTFDVFRTRVRSRFGNAPNGKPYDLRIGSTISDLVDAPLPEIEIFYDRLRRILRQGYAQYQGGVLLKLRAEEHGVIAKPAVAATGVMKITSPAGTVIPTKIRFTTTVTANTGQPPITFSSTETLAKTQKNAVTGTATSATSNSLTDTTKTFTVNEWIGGYIWITGGTGVGQVFKILSNTATTITISSWEQGLEPDVTSTYQLFSGVDVSCDTFGTIGNVAANAINQLLSPVAFISAVTNPIAFTNGLSAETDAELLSRFLITVRNPSSGGNIIDYQTWAQDTPGVLIGQVSIIPLWAGNGTVKVVIMNADGTIPSAAVVAAVQEYIDPSAAGQGGGKAPIGAEVTVQAATAVAIDVSVNLTITPGFNAGLVISQVQQAIINYINNLPVGKSVLFTQVQLEVLYDPAEPNFSRAGVTDYDILSGGHGIKKSSSGGWTTANIVLAGTEKATAGTVTVTGS